MDQTQPGVNRTGGGDSLPVAHARSGERGSRRRCQVPPERCSRLEGFQENASMTAGGNGGTKNEDGCCPLPGLLRRPSSLSNLVLRGGSASEHPGAAACVLGGCPSVRRTLLLLRWCGVWRGDAPSRSMPPGVGPRRSSLALPFASRSSCAWAAPVLSLHLAGTVAGDCQASYVVSFFSLIVRRLECLGDRAGIPTRSVGVFPEAEIWMQITWS